MRHVFLGDVHGKFKTVAKIAKKFADAKIVQVGDLGVGFRGEQAPVLPKNFRFIRGNHDNLETCRTSENFVSDGILVVTDRGNTMFHVGGAKSIDAHARTEGLDWWRDEELSYAECLTMIERYEIIKPKVMVTHDGPNTVVRTMFNKIAKSPIESDRTRDMFDTMLSIHVPDLWVFGHWHTDETLEYKNCQFRCLGIESTLEVNL